MEPTFFAQYRGFELHCSPERLGESAFAPRLVIHHDDQAAVEVPVESPATPYRDPTSAARRAFAFGRRWVDGGFDGGFDTRAANDARIPLLPLAR